MEIAFWLAVLIVSLVGLVKSADYFTSAAEKIGKAIGISEFVIGITIVSVGTSIPELATALLSVVRNEPEIVIGNAIGSNIANVLLILGVGSIMLTKDTKFKRGAKIVDLYVLGIATGLIFLLGLTGEVSAGMGVLLVATYVGYIVYLIIHKHELGGVKGKFDWKQLLILVVTSVLIYYSADYAIKAVKIVAPEFGVPPAIVAVSVIALGTSLPELSVTVLALKKKQLDLALGNIIGSNIFNILWVIGIPAIFIAVPYEPLLQSVGGIVLLAATGLLIFVSIRRHLCKSMGVAMVLAYLIFVILMYVLKNSASLAY